MTTESELKISRYRATEKEADELGRIITVRRLRPSEQTRLNGMTDELVGFDSVKDKDGNDIKVSHRLPLVIAASVCKLGDIDVTFPRNRGELDSIYDRLDAEGLAAAGKALARLMQKTAVPESPTDEAKNLSGTPPSS